MAYSSRAFRSSSALRSVWRPCCSPSNKSFSVMIVGWFRWSSSGKHDTIKEGSTMNAPGGWGCVGGRGMRTVLEARQVASSPISRNDWLTFTVIREGLFVRSRRSHNCSSLTYTSSDSCCCQSGISVARPRLALLMMHWCIKSPNNLVRRTRKSCDALPCFLSESTSSHFCY